MAGSKALSLEEKDLIKRYLLWCYKTTKEELDLIDRKFTQLSVDQIMLRVLERPPEKDALAHKEDVGKYQRLVKDFKKYVQHKEKAAWGKKYMDPHKTRYQPEYYYHLRRLKAIESATVELLGKRALEDIKRMFQQQMMERILRSTEKD